MGDLLPNETREYIFDFTVRYAALMRADFFVASAASEPNYADKRAYIEKQLSMDGAAAPARLRIYLSFSQVSLYSEDESNTYLKLQRSETATGPWEDVSVHRASPGGQDYLSQFWITGSTNVFFRLQRP